MSSAPAVLFVCLGNICRSPLAEGALRAAAERAGLAIDIDSAGTGAWHAGNPPDRRAQEIAMRHGVDISRLRARQLDESDFHRFTHILALDEANLADILACAHRATEAHIGLLLDLVPGMEGREVADPYYGGIAGFERCWIEVTAAADALVERFQR